MPDELRRRLDALRAIAPRLNQVTDEAAKIIAAAEKVLVSELGVGVAAQVIFEESSFALAYDDEANEGSGATGALIRHLAFGRVNGVFHIHIFDERERQDASGDYIGPISEERTPWPSCDRETKLRAFQKLPELLDCILSQPKKLAEIAEGTTTKVKQMGEFQGWKETLNHLANGASR